MKRNDEGYEEIGYTQALTQYYIDHKHQLRKVLMIPLLINIDNEDLEDLEVI